MSSMMKMRGEVLVAQKKYEDALKQWKADPEYVVLKSQLDKLTERLFAENQPKVDAALTELQDKRHEVWLAQLAEKKRKQSDEASIPQRVKSALNLLTSNYVSAEKYSIAWFSMDEGSNSKFMLVRQPGSMCWNGIGLGSSYVSTQYILMDVDKTLAREPFAKIKEWNGRWTKERQREMEALVAERKAKK